MYVIERFNALNLFSSLVLFCLIAFPNTAVAQLVFTTDPDLFLEENVMLQFQDYEFANLGSGEFEECNSPANSDSNDDCFVPGDIHPEIEFSAVPNDNPDDGLILIGPDLIDTGSPPFTVLTNNYFAEDFEVVFFEDDITAVGIFAGCVTLGPCTDQEILVEVYGEGDIVLDDILINVSDSFDTFLGIVSDEPITRIEMFGALETFVKGISEIYFGPAGAPGSGSSCSVAGTGSAPSAAVNIVMMLLLPALIVFRKRLGLKKVAG